jgi:hypothetical protein
MENEVLENRKNMNNYRIKTHAVKLLTGSIIDKFPVVMDGGKTIIFISDKSKESETRERYELRRGNKVILPLHSYSRRAKTP